MLEVEMPDGSIAEFPDGTSPEVMKRAAQRYTARLAVDQGVEAVRAGAAGRLPEGKKISEMSPAELRARISEAKVKQAEQTPGWATPAALSLVTAPPLMVSNLATRGFGAYEGHRLGKK